MNMGKMIHPRGVVAVLSAGLVAAGAWAADAPAGKVMLPQQHEYQRTLRNFMATLPEQDFDHGVTNKLTVPPLDSNAEHQYRTFIMAMLQQPHVGGKRGIGAVNAPAHNFLLSTIEGTSAITVPPVWEEAMATFIRWDAPGNVYHDNRMLKMRTFVTAAVKMMMLDDFLENPAHAGLARADWNGYHLITVGSAYPVFKDQLPAPVQKAYEAGLLRLGRKFLAMGPKGEECDYEMAAAVGLWYVAHATGDAEFAKQAEAYARKLCTDPGFSHPAGYWTEVGGLDVGFGGMANFWAVWLALASDWPFASEAVAKVYRLRAHLTLPEPDGKRTGPSEFNNRLGSPACEDQWHWEGTRDLAAAMLTDEAVCLIKLPTDELLTNAMALRVQTFNDHLYGQLKNGPYMFPNGKYSDEKGEGRYLRNDELRGHAWEWRLFWNGFNYPIEVNPGYEFYREGAYAHLVDLQKQKSPMLQLPVMRPEPFVVNFGDAFIVAKRQTFSAILHVGPVGHPAPAKGMAQYKGPMGFGGGQLSAFWTPEAGATILGRRGGMAMRGADTLNFDSNAVWRLWPIHAVSGCTADGKVFTSARIVGLDVTDATTKKGGTVKVSGTIAGDESGQINVLQGAIRYTREFEIGSRGVKIETRVSLDGKDKVAELYETLPVYLGDGLAQKTNAAVTIAFQAAGKWAPATTNYLEKVTAIRITRFAGAVQIAFDRPQRVKLAPAEWADTFLTRAFCRNIMIDLMELPPRPAGIKTAAVGYKISAVRK